MAQSNNCQVNPSFGFIKAFQTSAKSKLSLAGYAILFLGTSLFLFLIWSSMAAKRLDSLPDQYSQPDSCDRAVDHLSLSDRVIPVGNETTIMAMIAREYMEQDCPETFTLTLTAPSFDATASLQRDFVIVSDREWKGGAWILKSKRTGLHQVFVDDGELSYAVGISVIPRLLGMSLSYQFLEITSGAFSLFGVLLVVWGIKSRQSA